MALETAGFISALNAANPTAVDGLSQGDDHLRLLKSTLLATFPAFTAVALASSQAQLDAAVAFSTGGLFKAALGLVSAPTFTFLGDLTTGMWQSAAGKIDIGISGADVGQWSSTGLKLLTGDLNLITGALKFNGTSPFPIQSANIGAAQVLTAAIAPANVTTALLADANVTYAKIQNVGAAKLLGNPTGSPAAASEITLGANLSYVSGALTYTPPALTPAQIPYGPKAWVHYTVAGGVLASYNIASVTRVSAGAFQIVFTTAMADANFAPVATVNFGGGALIIEQITGQTTTTVSVNTFTTSTGVLTDPVGFSMAFFGN